MITTINEFKNYDSQNPHTRIFTQLEVEGMLEDVYMHVAKLYNDQGLKNNGEYRNEAIEFVKNYLQDK